MNIEQKSFNIGCYSIQTVEDNHQMIYQNSTEIHKHDVNQGYLVLSKNDFGKIKKRVNLGVFNKKTNFVIGEKNSLIFWDNETKTLTSPLISSVIETPSRYFMVYDLSFMGEMQNTEINIYNKKSEEYLKIILNKQFGRDIGSFLKRIDPKTTTIPDEFSILKSVIFIKNGKLSINKQLLVNSNIEFLLGILEGYLDNISYFSLKPNINIYNFTYILNLLGAQYSIRSLDNGEKHIRFKLPIFLKPISSLNRIFFRSYKYLFEMDTKNLTLKKDIIGLSSSIESNDFFEMVNGGLIEMVSAKDLVFIPLEMPTIMYDLTMPNANATNYSLPVMPLAKNSDGDVLGVVAIHTKDAAEECMRKFSTELKENFLNLSTGEVNNHGVKLDSQLGIYAATK